ncbi:MAG: DNA translocase FtsK [Chloroflexota bacterium]
MPSKTTKKRDSALSPVVQRKPIGVALFLAGGGTMLSLLFPQGQVTGGISWFLLRVAGWGAMALPVAMMWAGGVLLRAQLDPDFRIRRWQVVGDALLLLCFLGMLHLLPLGEANAQARADGGQGGGWLGLLMVAPLLGNLGMVGSVVVLATGLVAGAFLGFWVHPRRVAELVVVGWERFSLWQAERSRDVLINPDHDEAASVAKAEAKKPKPAEANRGEAGAEGSSRGPVSRRGHWPLPSIELFESIPETEVSQLDIRQRIRTIEETLRSFGVEARVVEVNQGPAVTQFGVEPGVGVKVSRIMALGNDLALRLAAAPLRMEAPVPGKQVVGIEVPNGSVSVVSIRDLLESSAYQKSKGRLRLAMGRDVSGNPVTSDLTRMPHLLIAGSTGSGKSVCLNSFIAALLCQCTPDDLRLLMIDPKMVELMPFNGVPHLLTPVVTDMEKVVPSLKWIVREMERRYRMFAARGARNVDTFNRMVSGKGSDLPLPFIVVIIDELADLMMVAPDEVERIICRLAQLARATGIHLVVATQRPSVDVVTGLIKANFPTRISFAVTSQVDSRTILDQAGAEKLLGKGDMLYMPPDAAKPVRLQGTYVSDGEIRDLVDYWKKAKPPEYVSDEADAVAFEPVEEEETDDLYEQAVEVVSQHSQVSVSLLQRKLRIGYNRAARLMEELEEQGVVGLSEGGRTREVLVRSEEASEEREVEKG